MVAIDTRRIAPPQALTIPVANIASVARVFNQISVEACATRTGTYVEIGTLPLRADAPEYEFWDDLSAVARYYRMRYRNTRSGKVSSYTDPVLGDDDPGLSILSVEELKSIFLFGLQLSDGKGHAFPNAMYEFSLKAAVSYIEGQLDVMLRPTAVVDERHDFDRDEWENNQHFKLDNAPVISLDRARMFQTNDESTAIEMDIAATARLDKQSGVLNFVPTTSAFLPGLYAPGVIGANGRGPLLYSFSYTAGYSVGTVPDCVRELVGMAAALEPLNHAGELILGAGVARTELSIDGISRRVNTTSSPENNAYSPRIRHYVSTLASRIPQVRRTLKGVRIVAA